MTITNEMMTLIGLIVAVTAAMVGMLLAMGRYQRQVDQNTEDIDTERMERKEADQEIKEQVRDEKTSSYKRDSDLFRDIRMIEERVTQLEIHDGPAGVVPIKKKEA